MADPVVPQDKPNDDFEAAFAQISEADAVGKTVKPEDIKPAPVVEKTPEQVEADRVAADAAAAATKTPEQVEAERVAADAAAAATKTPEQVEAERVAAEAAARAGDQDLLARLATLVKSADPAALAREVAAAAEVQRVADASAAAAEADALKQRQQLGQLNPTDLALVQQVEKDFPDVMRASAAVRRAEYNQISQGIVTHVFNEVQKALLARDEQLAPFMQLVQNLAERTHVGDLRTVVPDYDKIDVKALRIWVDKQPAYLKPAYDGVLRTGTTDEVKDLIDRFHAESGAKQVTTPDPAATAAAAAAETARKKAIAALAPVASQRAGSPAAEAPSGFGDAFDAFAKEFAVKEGNDRFTR